MALRTKRKILVALLAFSVSGAAIAYSCPTSSNFGAVGQVVKTIANLAQQVYNLMSSFNNSNSENERNIKAAVKTQAKQVAASAEKEILNINQSMQSLSTTLIAQDASLEVQKTQENFSAKTGQGYDPCGELRRSKQISESYLRSVNVTEELRLTLDRAPGEYKDPLTTQSQRLSDHNNNYCTENERNAKLCTGNNSRLAGASLTFATMFKKGEKNGEIDKAKNAFVNNIFGLPDAPVAASVANTPEGQAAMRDKMMRDGYLSIAATSFKAIQAMYQTGGSSSSSSSGSSSASSSASSSSSSSAPSLSEDSLSFMEGVSNMTGQYSGDNGYKEWATSLTIQSERGLMVNLAKMSAMKLYLASVEFDQYERMEANLAALLALENRKRAGY